MPSTPSVLLPDRSSEPSRREETLGERGPPSIPSPSTTNQPDSRGTLRERSSHPTLLTAAGWTAREPEPRSSGPSPSIPAETESQRRPGHLQGLRSPLQRTPKGQFCPPKSLALPPGSKPETLLSWKSPKRKGLYVCSASMGRVSPSAWEGAPRRAGTAISLVCGSPGLCIQSVLNNDPFLYSFVRSWCTWWSPVTSQGHICPSCP